MPTQPKRFKMINEALDWAMEAKTTDDLRERVRAISLGNSILMRFLAWGVGYEEGPSNLPEGAPPLKDEGLPEGISDATITSEFRRLLVLLPEGSGKNVKQVRREEIFIEVCQGVHPKEADLIVAAKDKTLLQIYPRLAEVLPDFLTGWKAPEVKKKRVSKKSSTTAET